MVEVSMFPVPTRRAIHVLKPRSAVADFTLSNTVTRNHNFFGSTIHVAFQCYH